MTVQQVFIEPCSNGNTARALYCHAHIQTDVARLSFAVKSNGKVEAVSTRFNGQWKPAFWLTSADHRVCEDAIWDKLEELKRQQADGAA